MDFLIREIKELSDIFFSKTLRKPQLLIRLVCVKIQAYTAIG